MLDIAKTALLLLLYPVLYLRLPLTLKWFAASLAGLGVFVVLLTNLRDLSATDSAFSQTGAPLVAYWGGYAAAGGVVLLNNWIEQSFPRPIRARASPRAIMTELESIARTAATTDLELATSSLSEREKSAIVLDGYLTELWAVFDWYIPAAKAPDPRVILRSAVDRTTNKVVVEPSPTSAKHPHSLGYLAVRSGIASLAVAAAWTLIGAVLHNARFHEWPTPEQLAQLLLEAWLVVLTYFALVLLRFRSMIPIRLPTGELLFVARATARKA